MRPQLFRAAAQSLRAPRARLFSTTAPRAAEVELTIGKSSTLQVSCIGAKNCLRWQKGLGRR